MGRDRLPFDRRYSADFGAGARSAIGGLTAAGRVVHSDDGSSSNRDYVVTELSGPCFCAVGDGQLSRGLSFTD